MNGSVCNMGNKLKLTPNSKHQTLHQHGVVLVSTAYVTVGVSMQCVG